MFKISKAAWCVPRQRLDTFHETINLIFIYLILPEFIIFEETPGGEGRGKGRGVGGEGVDCQGCAGVYFDSFKKGLNYVGRIDT